MRVEMSGVSAGQRSFHFHDNGDLRYGLTSDAGKWNWNLFVLYCGFVLCFFFWWSSNIFIIYTCQSYIYFNIFFMDSFSWTLLFMDSSFHGLFFVVVVTNSVAIIARWCNSSFQQIRCHNMEHSSSRSSSRGWVLVPCHFWNRMYVRGRVRVNRTISHCARNGESNISDDSNGCLWSSKSNIVLFICKTFLIKMWFDYTEEWWTRIYKYWHTKSIESERGDGWSSV